MKKNRGKEPAKVHLSGRAFALKLAVVWLRAKSSQVTTIPSPTDSCKETLVGGTFAE